MAAGAPAARLGDDVIGTRRQEKRLSAFFPWLGPFCPRTAGPQPVTTPCHLRTELRMAIRPADAAIMRQALIAGPERFEVVSAPRPRLRDRGEVIVRTAACGICSGDLMPWYLARKVGTVLGHEVVGRAAEVGDGVAHVRPGDLVFLHHHAPCLSCPQCTRGAFVHCPTWPASRLESG